MKIFLMLLTLTSFYTLSADTIDFTNSISPRNLGSSSITYGNADASFTTSVVGISLNRVSDLSTRLITSTVSKLVLQNTNLVLDGDYSFTYSSLQIVGDVNISGCGNTFKFFGNSLLISAGSTLRLSDDITFDYTPSSSSDRAIVFQDCDSTLFLDNATLNIDNGEISGLRFYNGKLKVAGESIVSLASTFTDNSLFLGGGAEGDTQLEIVANSNLTISNGNIISQNSEATSFKIASNALILGSFLFRGISDGAGSVQALDLLNKICNIDIARLSGATLPGSLITLDDSPAASANYGEAFTTHSVHWSPNGRYLAVCGANNPSGGVFGLNELGILEFTGTSFNVTTSLSVNTGSNAGAVRWSPDGRHLAVGTNLPSNETGSNVVSVFLFENNLLTLVGGAAASSLSNISKLSWSPDGRFLAAVAELDSPGGAFGSGQLAIFEFSGVSLAAKSSFDLGESATSVSWSPNSDIIAASTNTNASGGEVFVLNFDGNSISEITSFESNSDVEDVSWSPNGKFLGVVGNASGNLNDEISIFKFNGSSITSVADANYGNNNTPRTIGWSPDGRFIVVGGTHSGGTGADDLSILEFTGDNLITATSTGYFSVAGIQQIDWSPDGDFLAIVGDDQPGGIFGTDGIFALGVNYESTNVTDNVKNFSVDSGAITKNETIIKSL